MVSRKGFRNIHIIDLQGGFLEIKGFVISFIKSKSISVRPRYVLYPIPKQALAGGEASGDSKEDRR